MLSELNMLFLCPFGIVIAFAVVKIDEEFDDTALIYLHGLLFLIIEIDA